MATGEAWGLALLEAADGSVRRVWLGEAVDGFVLTSVEPRRAVLARGAETRTVEPGPGGASAPGASQAPGLASGGARLTRARVEQLERDFVAQAAGLHVIPAFAGGRATGLKLVGLPPGSVLTELGLRRGDVVAEVNGAALTSPESVLGLLERLRSTRTFEVRVLRGGVPVQLTVQVD